MLLVLKTFSGWSGFSDSWLVEAFAFSSTIAPSSFWVAKAIHSRIFVFFFQSVCGTGSQFYKCNLRLRHLKT